MNDARVAKLAELEADTEKTPAETTLQEALVALKGAEEGVTKAEADVVTAEEAVAKEVAGEGGNQSTPAA